MNIGYHLRSGSWMLLITLVLPCKAWEQAAPKSVEQKKTPSPQDASTAFVFGQEALRQNRNQDAAHFFEIAARAGNTKAMVSLGVIYTQGQGVPLDYTKACFWFEKAATLDNVDAIYDLGAMFYGGLGVAQNYQTARYWFEKAAGAGNTQAMYHLGKIYERGLGVAKDEKLARQWYDRTARTDSTEPRSHIEGALEDSSIDKTDRSTRIFPSMLAKKMAGGINKDKRTVSSKSDESKGGYLSPPASPNTSSAPSSPLPSPTPSATPSSAEFSGRVPASDQKTQSARVYSSGAARPDPAYPPRGGSSPSSSEPRSSDFRFPAPQRLPTVASPQSSRVDQAESERDPAIRSISPSQSNSDLDQVLQNAIDALKPGQEVFHHPDEMELGKPETVQVRISANQEEDIAKSFSEQGVTEQDQIRVSTLMKVHLTGAPYFEVTPLNADKEQLVTKNGFTEWSFTVVPLKGGRWPLHLAITSVIRMPWGSEAYKDYPIKNEQIFVRVTVLGTTRLFLAEHWQWLWTAMLVPLVGWRLKRRQAEVKRASA